MIKQGKARWLGVVSAVFILATVVSAGAFADGEPQGTPPSAFFTFTGVAAADGARFHLVIPGAPASNDVLDSGGPMAQAMANSVGTVRGVAAFPYPGETGLTLMSTGAGALGSSGVNLPAEPPAYPMAATSDYPGRPEQTVGGGPFHLRAVSNEAGAEAAATAGGDDGKGAGVGLVASTASVKRTADGVVSDATFRATALAAGPLTVGRVVTSAKRIMTTSGETSEATSLEVLGADIGGTKFSLTTAGLTLAGTAAPLPIESGLKSLNEQLAPAGAAVRFSPQRKTPEGVIAPVLDVVVPFKQTAGFDGTLTVTLGGAGAFLQGAKTGDPDAEPEVGAPPPADSSASSPAPGFASSSPALDSFAGPSVGAPDSSLGREAVAFPTDTSARLDGIVAAEPDTTAPLGATPSSPAEQETVQLAVAPDRKSVV